MARPVKGNTWQRLELPLQRYFRQPGQNLANLLPVAPEIEAIGSVYMCTASASENDLKESSTEPTKSQPPSEVDEFSHIYSSLDVDRLDQVGANFRTGMTRIPDPRTLGESQRTTGRLIDANNATDLAQEILHHLVIEYRDVNDQPQCEEMTNFEL